MELCNDGHDEVCYDSRYCPACSLEEDAASEIATLKDKINDLNGEIADLNVDLINQAEINNG
jgi:hypothetical protein